MKTVTFRLPAGLIKDLEREAKARRVSKSDVVRDRLHAGTSPAQLRHVQFDGIADLIGAVHDLAPDVSGYRKRRLKATGYGRKRPR